MTTEEIVIVCFGILVVGLAILGYMQYHSYTYCAECKRKIWHEVIDSDDFHGRIRGKKLKRDSNLICTRYEKHSNYHPTASGSKFDPPQKSWPLI